jgi:2'-5' RNA ligase
MRLFIAISFPEQELRAISDRIALVKMKLPPASWVRAETQHLTFAFLGEQPESLLPTVSKCVEESLSAVPRFEARLRGSGFFPNARHARVGWVGAGPEEKFREVADAVRSGVKAAGITLDRADFRAHLTLFRIRDQWPPACIEIFNGALRDYKSDPIPVDSETLFSSELNPKGANHTPMRTYALANSSQ